jgi:hypothetical protein
MIESLIRFDQIEAEQRKLQSEQLALLQAQANLTQRLDQIETAQTHFTVVGYMSTVVGKSLPLLASAAIGKRATRLCKERGLEVGSVPDPRFGKANTYPKHILDEVLADEVAALTT